VEGQLLIVNADDWGGWKEATDTAHACHSKGRITSVSAMVFMEDSARAAELAKQSGVDAGLHLNLNQRFTQATCPPRLLEHQDRTRCFLRSGRYAQLIYNPLLRTDFEYVYRAQVEEFARLYSRAPSHIDGHQHMHLCANMLVGRYVPRGEKVRRNFSFWPGEKGLLNRVYRHLIDGWLARRYRLTDYFFSLAQCLKAQRLDRVVALAKVAKVELMAHPEKSEEFVWLMSDGYASATQGLFVAPYSAL